MGMFDDIPKAGEEAKVKNTGLFDDIPISKPESFGAGVVRGGKEAFQQLPQLGYGLLAGVGAAIESAAGEGGIGTGLKKAGVEGYQRWGDKIAAGAKQSDSWDYAWDQAKRGNFGALVDWIAHGIGYTGGQGLQMLLGAGVGAIAGKATLGTVAESIAQGLVKKEALRIAEEEVAKSATKIGASEIAARAASPEVIKAATSSVASTIGQTSAVAASSFAQEGGEIFGDLVSTAQKEGRQLSGAELGKAFAASLAAGGLEFVGDKLGLDVILGRSKLLKPAEAMTGLGGRAARAGLAAAAQAPIEGATEYLQTGLEQYGKGEEANILPFNQSAEGQKQARESAALGILGGVVMGGAGGALQGPKKGAQEKPQEEPPKPPLLLPAPTGILGSSAPRPVVQFPDGTYGTVEDAQSYINSQVAAAPPEQQADVRQTLEEQLLGIGRPKPTPAEIAAKTGGRATVADILDADTSAGIEEAIEMAQRAVGYRTGLAAIDVQELDVPTLTDVLDGKGLMPEIPVGQASEADLASVRAPLLPVGEATEMLPVGEATEIEDIPISQASEMVIGATEAWASAERNLQREVDAARINRILDGDMLTKDGMPYGSKTAALLRAKREGLDPLKHVVEIPNAGWVVRPNLQVQVAPQAPLTPVAVRPGNAPGFNAGNTRGVMPGGVQQQQPGATTAQGQPGQEITGGAQTPGQVGGTGVDHGQQGQGQGQGGRGQEVLNPPGGSATQPPTAPAGGEITGGASQPRGPIPGEAQPSAVPVPRKGTIGMKLGAGEVVLTSTGRRTTPFPKVKLDTDRKATATVKAVDRWLMQNAADEARARGDDFNLPQFEANLEKPSQADKDSAEEYLFGGNEAGKGLPEGTTAPGEPQAPQAPTGETQPPAGGGAVTGGPTAPAGGATGGTTEPGGGKTGGPEPKGPTAPEGEGKTEPKAPEPEPKQPEPEKPKEEPKPKPVRSQQEQDLLDIGEAVAAGDAATIARIVYTDMREHEEADVPVVLPEDRLVRFPVKLDELKRFEDRLIALKFRISDKLQETKEALRMVVSAIFMPKKGEITGGGEKLRDNNFSRPQKDAPDDALDKALDRLLAPLHPGKLLDPHANENQTFGNMMFKEAVYSIVDYPLAFIASSIRKKFSGYRDVKSDREVLKSAMQEDVQFEHMMERVEQYKSRLTKLAETLTPHDGIEAAFNALRAVYFLNDAATTDARYAIDFLTLDGKELYWTTGQAFTRQNIIDWYKKFSADENSTDQTWRVKKKDPDMPPPLGDIKRVGMKDHRHGKDITDSEDFVKAFGFKGVKFGDWVNQAERQAQMNLAYDSLMDLADLIGMPPTMIGLGGKLGLGIGAYGNEKTSAAAFYMPGDEVFNLTKDNGRGTVAHEWFHAFEDITAKYQKDSTLAQHARDLFNSLPKLFQSYIDLERADANMRASLKNASESQNRNRPPKKAFVNNAFGAYRGGSLMVRDMRRGLDFFNQAAKMDDGGKAYWAKPVELLARGFETLIYDKAEGGTPFLVGPSRADGVMSPTNGYKGIPYPRGKERVTVADLYKELLKWIDLSTLAIKPYTREMQVVELPDGQFASLDQMGLGTNRYVSFSPNLFEERKAAQEHADKHNGEQFYPTIEQILAGRAALQAVEFSKTIDKTMEEMGIKPTPEIRNGSMVESMFQHLRFGWWPADNKELRTFAATAHEVNDRDLNPLQMKQAQEDFEAALGRYAQQITVDMRREGADTKSIYDKMVELYKRQPRLTERTMESELMQRYSTPLPIAWLSGMLARVTPNTKVFDATGGNGLLTLAAEPQKVTLIELAKERIRNLNLLKFGRVIGGDFFEEMPKIRDQEADVVLLNPPFGSLPNGEVKQVAGWNGRVYDMRKIDHAIAAQGLRAMADKGRAVVILGANKSTGQATLTDKVFLSWLYGNYNVADHFEVAGDMYARQGAQWPIRVLVIAGRDHTNQVYNGDKTIDRVDSWDALWSRYEQALSNSERVVVGTGKQPGVTGGPTVGPGVVPGGGAVQGPGTGGQGGRGGQGASPGQPGAGGTGAGPAGTGSGGSGGATGGQQPAGPTGGASQPGRGPAGQPGSGQGGNRGTGGSGSTGSAPVNPNDINKIINSIFGDDDDDAPSSPPRDPPTGGEEKKRKRGEKKTADGKPEGSVTKPNDGDKPPTPPKPPGGGKPAPGKSVLDDIPGLGDLLGVLDNIVGGGTVDPKVLSDLTADKPTGSQEDQSIEKVADDTGMSDAMARSALAPAAANLPDILSNQRRDAELMLRDIRRANDALLEARENPTAKPESVNRPMFSRAPNEDSMYATYLPVFKAVWEKIKAAIEDAVKRIQVFAQGMLQRYGKEIKPYVVRFVTDVQEAEKKKPIEAEEVANETQSPYLRRSQAGNSQGVLIPTNQASRLYDAMDRVERAVGDFDEYVRSKLKYDTVKDLSDALFDYQIDATAMAIAKMEQGGSFIVGDDTGVGKGRTAAALITWAVENGRVPIFATFNRPLYGDMYRDLQGIGRADLADKILITDTTDKVLDDDDNVVIKPMDKDRKAEAIQNVLDKGALPDDLKIVFTTYHQINSPGNKQQRMIAELVKSGKAVLIMDEAHNGAGDSNRGDFLTQILTGNGLFGMANMSLANPPPAGWAPPPATFLSATFAKHARNMPFYSRTDLGHVGSRDDIVGLFTGRGNAMTEVVSEMLVEAGSMIRRERSYSGVGFRTFVDEANAPRDERLVDEVTTVLRQILRANRAFLDWAEAAGRPIINSLAPPNTVFTPGKKGRMEASVNLGNFASVAHNIIEQLLFATKVDSLVDETVKGLNGELHRDGKSQKIFIAFKNTMESMMNDYMENQGLKDGDQVPEFGWQHVIARSGLTARRANFDTVSRDPNNPKARKKDVVRVTVPLNVMPAPIAREFERIEEMLSTFQSTLPASPVDMLTQKLEQYSVIAKSDSVRVTKDQSEIAAAQAAGADVRQLRVGEISGRTRTVDYMAPVPTINSRKKSDTRKMVGGFQNGGVDVLLANAAGSTGLSAHADVNKRDQRPRHMLIAQPNPDIAVFKQTTGRTHRTGQVEWPDFTVFATGIPAERRALAMLKQKVGVLMSGTTAGKGTMDIDATDFINAYGDAIVNEYLRENKEVANFVGVAPFDNSVAATGTGLAHTVTNKAALLPSDQQREFFDYVEEKYKDEIAARDATGTNELTRTTEDLQAEMDPDEYREVEDGIDENNPFLRPVIVAEYKTNVTGEIPTPTTVREAVKQSLNGRTPEQAVVDIEKSFALGYDAAVARLQSRLVELQAGQQAPGLSAKEKDDFAVRIRAVEGQIRDFSTVKERTLGLLRNKYTIGRPIETLTLNDVESQAVVVGYRISRSATGGGNPYAPSNISVVLQRNVPGGAVPMTLSKLDPPTGNSIASVNYWHKDLEKVVEDWFSLRNVGGGTEKRWIMTGNLPRGRVLVPGGDVLKFTIAGEKNPANGIRFPKKWSPGDLGKAGHVQIRYVESAREYMLEFLSHMWEGRYGFEDQIAAANAMRTHPEIKLDKAEYEKIRNVDSTTLRGTGWSLQQGYDGFYVNTELKSTALKDLLGDMPKRNGSYRTQRPVTDPEKIIGALNILAANNPARAPMEARDFVKKLVTAQYQDENPSARPAPPVARRESRKAKRAAAQAAGITNSGGSGQTRERVQSFVDQITSKWANAPKVVAVQSFTDEDMPASARDEFARLQRESGDPQAYGVPQGWFNPADNTIYLIADELHNNATTLQVLLHEAVGHFGMRAVFGADFAKVLDSFSTIAEKRVREMADRLGYDFDNIDDRRAAAEEVLAYMAETNPSYGWVRKIVATIAKWLRSVFPDLSLTDSEIIRDFIVPARAWVASGRTPPKPAPKTSASDVRFRMLDALRKAGGGPKIVGNVGRQYTPRQLRGMRNTGMLVDKPTLEDRVKDLWSNLGRKIEQGVFDQFAPIQDIDRHAYSLLRLAKGAAGAFQTMLQGGMLKIVDGSYAFDPTRRGGVIERLLKPLQGEHHDFLRWVAANRADQLTQEDREHLFSEQDIEDLRTLADDTTTFDYTLQHNINGRPAGTVTRDRTLIYADAAKTLDEFNKMTLDMAEESGLIDGESRQFWEKEFYVPFYRVADESEGGVRGTNIKSGVVRQEAFKHLKGGTQKLNADLMDNVLMNWAHLLDASAKNRAAKATLDALVDAGHAFESTETAARQAAKSMGVKDHVVWIKDGGTKHFYVVDDPAYMMALTSLEYAGLRGTVMDVMGGLKHAITVGVTASPFFKVRNLIRDSIQSIATSPIGVNPLTNVAEGWKLSNQTSDSYFNLLASGGTIHFGTMLEGSESRRIQALVESGIQNNTILNSDQKYRAFYRKHIEPWLTAYNELGNRGETVNRASLYDQLRKQGLSHTEASIQARDLMDFSMQGTWTAIRFLAQVVPFFNARLQGLYKLKRAAQEDPKRFAAVVGATAAASVMLLLAYSDDDDWRKREDWDRNNFWWFKIGGTAFRIPKPFEVGAIATLAERGFELFFDREMTGKRFRANVLNILSDQLNMDPIPQIAKPMLGVYANVDGYTGRPIETEGQKNLAPEYRFNSSTSMTARAASTGLNTVASWFGGKSLSPVQVDYLIQGYFAWLGTFVVQAADIVARPITDQPERPSRDWLKTATGGMLSDLNDAQSRYVSQMYDQGRVLEQAYHTYRTMLREGKVADATEYLQEHREEISKYRQLERAKSAETKLNLRQRQIENDSTMSAEQKRNAIREILSTRERIAKPVTEAIQ